MIDGSGEFVIEECERLFRSLAHRMLAGFPKVRRWEETDDIVQDAMLQLITKIQGIRPRSELHARRLVGLLIRRRLLDLARRYSSPNSHASNYQTGDDGSDAEYRAPSLSEWAEFHRAVDRLPNELRETFELSWYTQMSSSHIATQLGITARQVQRRMRNAQVLLMKSVDLEKLFQESS